MDEREILHRLRNLIRALFTEKPNPFLQVEPPPTEQVDAPLVGGAGVVPAVGGTIIEQPSFTSSPSHYFSEEPKRTFSFETPKVEMEIRGSTVIVPSQTVRDILGREWTVEGGEFELVEGLNLVIRGGQVVWTPNVLPTDIPLYPKPKITEGGEEQ